MTRKSSDRKISRRFISIHFRGNFVHAKRKQAKKRENPRPKKANKSAKKRKNITKKRKKRTFDLTSVVVGAGYAGGLSDWVVESSKRARSAGRVGSSEALGEEEPVKESGVFGLA